MRGGALVTVSSHQSFQAMALTITIYLRSPPCKGAPPANTVDHLLLLIPSQGYHICRTKPFLHRPLHQTTPHPSSLAQGTAYKWQRLQTHQSSAFSSHQLYPTGSSFPTLLQLLQGHLPGMAAVGVQHFFNFTASQGQPYGHTMGTSGPVSTHCQTTRNSLQTQHSLQFGHFSATSCSPLTNF